MRCGHLQNSKPLNYGSKENGWAFRKLLIIKYQSHCFCQTKPISWIWNIRLPIHPSNPITNKCSIINFLQQHSQAPAGRKLLKLQSCNAAPSKLRSPMVLWTKLRKRLRNCSLWLTEQSKPLEVDRTYKWKGLYRWSNAECSSSDE